MNKFNVFLDHLQTTEPGVKIRFKNQSAFMKILGVLLFFNPKFMNEFTTTIGKTVYFPSEKFIEEDEDRAIQIVAHEFKHILDNNKYGILFPILYLFPQILAPLALLAFINLWFLLFLVFFLPLPAYWRTKFESDAYTISLFFGYLELKRKGYIYEEIYIRLAIHIRQLDRIVFKGGSYYFMWPFGISKKLFKNVNLMKTGDILKIDKASVIVKEGLDKIYR